MIINNNRPSNTNFQARVVPEWIGDGINLCRHEIWSAITETEKLATAIPHSEDDIIVITTGLIDGKISGGLLYYKEASSRDRLMAREQISPESDKLFPSVEQWVEAAKRLIKKATGTQPIE